MRHLLWLLLFAPLLAPAQTGQTTLTWTAPTTNTDGSPLTNLTGYKAHYGTSPTALTQTQAVGVVTTTTITGLTPATWYFSVSAVTPSAESAFSNTASKLIAGSGPVTIGGPVFNPSSTTDAFLPLEVGSVVAGKPCDASQQLVFGGKTYMIVKNASANVTPLPGTQVVAAMAECR